MNGFDYLCDKVAREIPFGWQLQITLEIDSGDVELTSPDGDVVEFPSNHECLSDTVTDALDEAKKQEQTP